MRKDLDTSDMLSKLKKNMGEMDDRTLFGSLGITIEQMISRRDIIFMVEQCRGIILKKYGDVQGHCVECSELIVSRLIEMGFNNAHIVEGWVELDCWETCSDCSYDPHTWVEFTVDGTRYVVDATGDQFNWYMYEDMPPVWVKTELPHGWCREEPSNKFDE